MREKLIELLDKSFQKQYEKRGLLTAPHTAADLIANGVTIPVLCQNCTHHDTDTCPENRVWCKMLRRYMNPDGYCSFGVKGETNEKVI